LRQRWALVLVTLLGGLVIINALLQPWLSTTLVVSPVRADSTRYGLDQAGIWGIVLAVGLILVLVLVAVAVVSPPPTAGLLALTALTASVALAVELGYLALRLGAARTASGQSAAGLLESLGDGRHDVWFMVHMPAGYAAASGFALLVLVAAQIPRPDLGPTVLALSGAAAGVISLVTPWSTAYFPVDGEVVIERYWLWSVDGVGVALGLGALVLVALGAAVPLGLRVPLPLMLGVVVVGFVVFWGPLAIEEAGVLETQLEAQDPMSLPQNAAPRFMEFAALLVAIAVVRTWWRARRGHRNAAAGGVPPGGAPAGSAPVGSAPAGSALVEPPTGRVHSVAGSPAWPTAR
jgi:hypothetical protein